MRNRLLPILVAGVAAAATPASAAWHQAQSKHFIDAGDVRGALAVRSDGGKD